jgi:hypothetical protein
MKSVIHDFVLHYFNVFASVISVPVLRFFNVFHNQGLNKCIPLLAQPSLVPPVMVCYKFKIETQLQAVGSEKTESKQKYPVIFWGFFFICN